jgi:hypothetical protein
MARILRNVVIVTPGAPRQKAGFDLDHGVGDALQWDCLALASYRGVFVQRNENATQFQVQCCMADPGWLRVPDPET